MNNFSAIGRVGRDAVTRHTQAGKPVTGFSLAVDDGWGDNKTTTWLDCSLWGERGEKVAQYITKGSQLGVTGSIGTREHDGKTYVTLRVAEVSLVGGKPDGERASRPAQRQDAPKRESAPAGDDFADDIPDF